MQLLIDGLDDSEERRKESVQRDLVRLMTIAALHDRKDSDLLKTGATVEIL